MRPFSWRGRKRKVCGRMQVMTRRSSGAEPTRRRSRRLFWRACWLDAMGRGSSSTDVQHLNRFQSCGGRLFVFFDAFCLALHQSMYPIVASVVPYSSSINIQAIRMSRFIEVIDRVALFVASTSNMATYQTYPQVIITLTLDTAWTTGAAWACPSSCMELTHRAFVLIPPA